MFCRSITLAITLDTVQLLQKDKFYKQMGE